MPVKLYPYQQADVDKTTSGVKWMLNASDMGVGKTHYAIEVAKRWRREVWEKTDKLLWPILIVTPINTFESWAEKLADQAPELSVCVIDRFNRDKFLDDVLTLSYDVYIMHYEAVRLVEPHLEDMRFAVIIADEVHKISNRDAQMTESLKKIKGYRKLGLSGTPTGERPWNLWSILNWLDPFTYNNYWQFVDTYVEQGYDENGYRKLLRPKNVAGLHWKLRHNYIRHMKREECCPEHPNGVMHFLPEKNYETLYVDLNTKQRRIYNEMFEQMVAWVNEQEDTPLVASVGVAKLTRLMQMTIATPRIETRTRMYVSGEEEVEEEYEVVELEAPSSKIELALDIVQQDDKPYVIFTHSKKAAYLCAEIFNAAGVKSEVLSGDTPKKTRPSMVARFKKGEYRVFIGVIQAAAEGIDGLQDVCDTAIFLSRGLSTIKSQQAEDRLYRGGQNHNVTIIDIVARDTIDTERIDVLNLKWAHIKEMINGNRSK